MAGPPEGLEPLGREVGWESSRLTVGEESWTGEEAPGSGWELCGKSRTYIRLKWDGHLSLRERLTG